MKTMKKYTSSSLAVASVSFDEEAHRYSLLDEQWSKELDNEISGVTSVLNAVIYRDKYKGISEEVMAQAARRGTEIHNQCAMVDLLGEPTERGAEITEVVNYHKWKDRPTIIANEYLVTNGVDIASSIDMIDEHLNLYDIKTTAKLDTEYISWQLSIYAYFFDMLNAPQGLKANKLFALWLRGDTLECVEVQRKTPEECEALFTAFRNGEYWGMPEYKDESDTTIQLSNLEREIAGYKELSALLEAKKQELLGEVEALMDSQNISKYVTERVTITKVKPSKSLTLDSKLLKEEAPDLWAKYSRESERKGYLKVSLNKPKQTA